MTSVADSVSLEEFVAANDLPHRAKVTEGYYEEGDDDQNREFSNGDILDIRRMVCPLVLLTFVDPVSKQEVRGSFSTRTQDLRFHVLTSKEAKGSAKQRVYRSVREVIDNWPQAVKCLAAPTDNSKPSSSFSSTSPKSFQKGDELRLVRLVTEPDGRRFLECSVTKTRLLALLPETYVGSFEEVPDLKSYTLQELVDIARVPRFLKIDQSFAEQTQAVGRIPPGYLGILTMHKPEPLVEVTTILTPDVGESEQKGTPLLVPINCDIQLSPREAEYESRAFQCYDLAKLVADSAKVFPFVARIGGWTEESGILRNHVTRPGDQLVFYREEPVRKILAHCGKRYFLIPTCHKGRFNRVNLKTNDQEELILESVDKQSFPFEVQYYNVGPYVNSVDDHLPMNDLLTFDALVKNDASVLVSKLFGDVIGHGFHLPLRTNITVQMDRRWKKSFTNPPQKSHLDSCSEEIRGSLYNKLNQTSSYEWRPAPPNPTDPVEKKTAAKSCPPAPPPRSYKLKGEERGRERGVPQPCSIMASRPQPPIPKQDSDDDDSNDDDHDYSYIDISSMSLTRSDSMTEEINKAGVEIPPNGNISNFSVDQMLFFLKVNHTPAKAISAWRRNCIDGAKFARMTDETLRDYDVNNPVIRFFRDRSKMHLNVLTVL